MKILLCILTFENKAINYKKSNKTKKKSNTNKTNISISPTLPDYGTNFNKEAYFYRRSKFRFNDGGYYITGDNSSNPSSNPFFDVPDFRYLNNSSSSYGSNGSSLLPLSSYNIAKTSYINHNDAISSVYVNLMKVIIYEHQNYTGRSELLDARGGPTYRKQYKRLKDLIYWNFLSRKSWNDKISSVKCTF